MARAKLLIVPVLVLATACGYFKSGTWEDDPKNFRRAWGVPPPEGMNVIHSWYRRSAHFTREEVYYFELVGDPAFAEAFAEVNNMATADPATLEGHGFCFDRPEWFAPEHPDRYHVWVGPRRSSLVLREEESDRIFVYACQL
nr:hypothetical protein [uncultured bacterium]